MFRTRSALVAVLAAAAVFGSTLMGDAAAPTPSLSDAPSGVLAPAQGVLVPSDVVNVYQTGPITAPVRDAALAAAHDVGAPAAVGRGFTAGLVRLRRGVTLVQHTRAVGWIIPMAVTALPLDAIAAVMGRDVAAVVRQGSIVLGRTTADLRGAQVGDVIDLQSVNGHTASYEVGLIADDADVGGTEIVMSTPMASKLGGVIDTRVLIYSPADRSALTEALVAHGLYANTKVRVRRSWDAADPDDTLSMATTKALLGEFDFDLAHLSSSGWTAMSPTWVANYMPVGRETYPTGIRAMCNRVIKADLRAALTEVANSGLSGGIEVGNTNSYGGCGVGMVRFSRITQALGAVSRHSWAEPIDMNTESNCQGCRPRMDCRIVRIFRKHHFAWGGNFLTPDGMHFEWVGEQRDTLRYPSKYCPNLVTVRTQRSGPPPPTARATMFAQDGWMGE